MKIKSRNKAVVGSTFSYLPESHFDRPKYTDKLRWPDDITQLTAQNISELHGKYTQLYAYANRELARINMAILKLQTDDSLRRNQFFRMNPSLNSQEKWKRDAKMETDPVIESIAKDISLRRIERTQAEMFVQNYERYLTALSRELTRKGSENTKM